jgi:hypothetical protein
MTDLSSIIARVEGGEGADRELDAAACVALNYGGTNSEGAENVRLEPDDWPDDLVFEANGEECCNPIPDLTTSLDAVIALCERVLPGWRIKVEQHDKWMGAVLNPAVKLGIAGYHAWCGGPSISAACRALLAAMLRAKEADHG